MYSQRLPQKSVTHGPLYCSNNEQITVLSDTSCKIIELPRHCQLATVVPVLYVRGEVIEFVIDEVAPAQHMSSAARPAAAAPRRR